MKKKTDKRTLKTKKALQEALAQLLTDRVLRKITVQEVADLAQVNRVTFYKHYLDIYDLYDQLESEVLADFGLLILNYREKSKNEFCEGLLDYIEANHKIMKMMFSPYNTGELRDKFCKMVMGLFRLMQTEKNNIVFTDVRMDYYSTYQAKGFIALIEKWVLEDFSQPRAFIIQTVSEFDTHTEKLISEQFN